MPISSKSENSSSENLLEQIREDNLFPVILRNREDGVIVLVSTYDWEDREYKGVIIGEYPDENNFTIGENYSIWDTEKNIYEIYTSPITLQYEHE